MRTYDLRPMAAEDLIQLAADTAAAGDIRHYHERGAFRHSWSVYRNHGLIACGGIQVLWEGRAEAWTALGSTVDRFDMLFIHRKAVEIIGHLAIELHLRRLEATALCGWRPGKRWLKMLGFVAESRMRNYAPDGKDHTMMVKLWPHLQVSQ